MTHRYGWLILFGVGWICLGACEDDTSGRDVQTPQEERDQNGRDGTETCEPGRTIACTCSDRQRGTQTCRSDRTGFTPCQCGDPSGGRDAGGDGSTRRNDTSRMDPTCSDDLDCPGDMRCNRLAEPDRCERSSKYILIQSTSPECEEEAAGPDLFGVSLEGPEVSGREWGEVVESNLESYTYDRELEILDGRPPDLSTVDGRSCPVAEKPAPARTPIRFREDSVVSLGCGGWVVLGFRAITQDGPFITLRNGQTIDVYEYGDQCCEGDPYCSSDEPFEVIACSGDRENLRRSISSCDEILASTQGRSSITITAPDSN